MTQTYQVAIRCEVLRAKVFRGERTPMVLGDPGEHGVRLRQRRRAPGLDGAEGR